MTLDESGWALRRADAAATIPHIWPSRNGDARREGREDELKLKPKLTLHDVAERGRAINAEGCREESYQYMAIGPNEARASVVTYLAEPLAIAVLPTAPRNAGSGSSAFAPSVTCDFFVFPPVNA